MDINKIKNNVPRTILKFSIPSVIAMILTTGISIVDGAYIGNYIGKSAIAAVNLGLPILYIYLAIGIMVGVGGASSATRLLGAKKIEKSTNIFNQTTLTTIVFLSILSIISLLFLDDVSNLFEVEESVKIYFNEYYFLMIIIYPILMLNINLGMFIRAEGRPEIFMIFSIISIVMNIILDYLFVSILKLGVSGIAIASMISIVIGLFYLLSYFWFKSKVFKFHSFNFSKIVLINTLQTGSSAFIGQISVCITTFALNLIIIKVGGINGVAAFTVAGYALYIFTMITIGFGQGISPIISFSHGSNEHKLGIKIRNITTFYASILGTGFLIILIITSGQYSRLFVNSDEISKMVTTGIPIFTTAFLFMGMNVITSFYFTAIGNAKAAATISASRGVIILLPCVFIFPTLWGMYGVWFIAPVTEFLTLFLSLYFIFIQNKSLTTKKVLDSHSLKSTISIT